MWIESHDGSRALVAVLELEFETLLKLRALETMKEGFPPTTFGSTQCAAVRAVVGPIKTPEHVNPWPMITRTDHGHAPAVVTTLPPLMIRRAAIAGAGNASAAAAQAVSPVATRPRVRQRCRPPNTASQ